ncbi:hypothetical protein [Nereida sp. MMG025]|uniref:hypothetical protein n=1 Tax=Nereida sp. MMG025 TaxID=2909981 RepID=UPI001F3DCB2B|nr:hypothetical protein [Nereida sp. MMG025]MCF6444020.1 hypothetical protein [Nereida sp. MMG025]
MSPEEIQQKEAEITDLVRAKLSLRGNSLAVQMSRARRRLSKSLIADGVYLAQAAALAKNPKLARQIDAKRVSRAHLRLRDHLETVNPRDRRIGKLLGFLGQMAFIAITVFVLVVVVLIWRGFL